MSFDYDSESLRETKLEKSFMLSISNCDNPSFTLIFELNLILLNHFKVKLKFLQEFSITLKNSPKWVQNISGFTVEMALIMQSGHIWSKFVLFCS